MSLRILATSIAIALSTATPSLAQAAIKHQIDIPRQQLGSALAELARQTRIQVVYSTDLVEGRDARALNGALTPEEALDLLLAKTGLRFEFLDAQTVTLWKDAPGMGVNTPSGAADGRTHSGEGATALGSGSTDLWNRFRLAQANPPSAGAGGGAESPNLPSQVQSLEEIIVTAQKRSERLIDVPQAVSVLTSEDLAAAGALQLRDFANSVPGLTYVGTGIGFSQVTLRGVTTGIEKGSSTAIYVDEVPYGSSSAFLGGSYLALDVSLFDLDRIEVLRGPQGTLYGASSTGGLLKYVTKQPDPSRFGVDAQVGTASTRDGGFSYSASTALNAPLAGDKAALRLSGSYSRDGGLIDNLALGKEDEDRSEAYSGRADLLLKPTDALSVRLTAFAQNVDRDGKTVSDYTLTGEPIDGPLERRHFAAEPSRVPFRLASATVNYDLGPAMLTSVTGYQTLRTHSIDDNTYLFGPLLGFFGRNYTSVASDNHIRLDKFTQELRLTSEGGERIDWVLGGYYTREKANLQGEMILRNPDGSLAENDVSTTSNPTMLQEYAAFGDLTLHITDRFDVTGGLRYAHNEQEYQQIGSGLLPDLGLGGSTPQVRSSEDVTTYLANARFHFNDRTTLYARFATGYRPGGPNFVIFDPATGEPFGQPTFEADDLKSYEVGIKGETEGRGFAFDLAGYYIDWSNMHITVVEGGFGTIGNARGGAHIQGIELALKARPTNDLVFSGAFTYQDPELAADEPQIGGVKGERLPNVPHFTANASADYMGRSSTYEPSIGATVNFIGKRTAHYDAAQFIPQYQLPDYTTVDIRAGITVGSVRTQLYVHNLLDERGQIYAAPWITPTQVSLIRGRTIGINLSTTF
jgi:outer membrane receptor protein involved in Fe transport